MTMQCPENFGSFTFNDVSFSPDEKGLIEVPDEAVSMALSHGITFLKETPSELEKDVEGMKIHEQSDKPRMDEDALAEKAVEKLNEATDAQPAQEGEAKAAEAEPAAQPDENKTAEEARPEEKAEATDAQPAQEGEATHA